MDPLIWAELRPPPPGLLASLWSARAPLAMAGTHQLRSTCPLILPAGQSGFIHMAVARFQQSGSMEGLLSSGVNWSQLDRCHFDLIIPSKASPDSRGREIDNASWWEELPTHLGCRRERIEARFASMYQRELEYSQLTW